MSNAIDSIKRIIDDNQKRDEDFKNFALQGGAGSGKTESLKEIISYISDKYPTKKVACITHTNVAANEILARIGDKYKVSTIHSFLNELIKNYKKNLKEVIHHIFCLPNINNETHADFKKIYEKYSSKLFSIKRENCVKVIGKREYDKSPTSYNLELNNKIELLNNEINKIISIKEHKTISYSESRFDSFDDLSFSHNSLLYLSYKLCEKFELLGKIIIDKYDFIFVDEYQDSNEHVINLFLNLLPKNKKTTIGLFGDSMQGIYDDGIGDVKIQIKEGKLVKIDKEDNFRCSKEVIDFINIIRTDDIQQELALKKDEEISFRKGEVKLRYNIYGRKPNAFSTSTEKENYLENLKKIIASIKMESNFKDAKILMLTNKSISIELNFGELYNVFTDRFIEVKEDIERELKRIQIYDIVELCKLYQEKKYNELIIKLKKNNFEFKNLSDKKKINDIFECLFNKELNLQEVLNFAFEKKLIKKSEIFKAYMDYKDTFLKEIESDEEYKEFEKLYVKGSNTVKRLKDNNDVEITEEDFKEMEQKLKQKQFYKSLFSDEIKFKEVLNYYSYLNEETEYITMHKTKGSGIENVIVVLDEYFWSKYNFKSIYDTSIEMESRYKNQKLFYVACSRTIKNLAIVRVIEDEAEELIMKEYFKNCELLCL
jgi:DNA helicase II / ATP-dependent DNA helicase PcrA